MRKGAFFITTTKRLPSTDFEILEYEMYRMSWGEATLFIMQKVTDGSDEVGDLSDPEEDLERIHEDEDDEENEGKGENNENNDKDDIEELE